MVIFSVYFSHHGLNDRHCGYGVVLMLVCRQENMQTQHFVNIKSAHARVLGSTVFCCSHFSLVLSSADVILKM